MPATSWRVQMERGPDWLFCRLSPPRDGGRDDDQLADVLWRKIDLHLTYRVVLEMDEVQMIDSLMIGQLLQLRDRVRDRGGLLRLCGVSDGNQRLLRTSRLERWFPQYPTRVDAVYAAPRKPR